jgi:hypothetical protein
VQRLLPGEGRPTAFGEQHEAIIESSGDLIHAERREAGGSKLERQGDTVQLAAHLDNSADIQVAEHESWLRRPTSLHEQLDCLRARYADGGGRINRLWHLE